MEEKMVREKIFRALVEAGATREGAVGVLCNIRCESAFKPSNVQNSFEKKVGSDAEYTAKVDSGEISKKSFAHDSAGYGLCQWTYWSRKELMYDFLKTKGLSIADLDGQIAFMIYELEAYKPVWKVLCSTHDVLEATSAVLRGYEKPADQSDQNCLRRASYGEGYIKELKMSGYWGVEVEEKYGAGKQYVEYLEKVVAELTEIIEKMKEEA